MQSKENHINSSHPNSHVNSLLVNISQTVNTILRGKNIVGRHTTQLQDLLKSHSNQDRVVLVKEQMDQWKRTKINANKYNQLIFDKGANKIQWRKDNIFNKGCWHNWTYIGKKKILDAHNKTFIKISPKWIKTKQ